MSSEIFVGRADELAAMTAELERARAGQPRVLWLSGPAGIGKSTLIRRFAAERPDVRMLRAGGDEAETGLPYGVVAQLLADVPRRLLRPLLRAGPSPEADPLAVGAELLAVLGELENPGPVVLVLDDAQWMDDASARALVFAVRRLRRDQVLVVLGTRDGLPASWERIPREHLPITGLRAEEIVELAGTAGGPALSPAAGRRLRDHTDGHPLHVRSLLTELSPAELADTSRILPAPRSFAALVLVRVAKLGTSGQGLVLAAAVLGTRCALADAVALAGVPDPLDGLDEAVRAGLLTEVLSDTGHDIAFAHELVRAAVYADLSPARRHALHRAAAERLDGDAALQHRIAAAVGSDPELAEELAARGRAGLDGGRWRQAADRLVAAAELSEIPAERSARLAAAVGAMITDGDLGRALRYEPDLRAGGHAAVLGRLEAMTGRFAAARETLTAALAAGIDDAGAAVHLALVALIEGDAAAAAERAREALANDPPPEVVGLARFVRVVGLAASGRRSTARDELAHPPPTADPDEFEALSGLMALWDDDPAGAAAILAGLVRDGSSPASVRARVLLLGHLSEAQYRVGDWDAAATNGALAVSLARDAGVMLGAGVANGLASYVVASRGAWDVATERVEASTTAAAVLPWWGARLYAASAQAVLAQARGDHAGMEKALRAYADPTVRGGVVRLGALPWRALHVESLLGLHRVAEAEAALVALEERSPVWSAVDAARLRCAVTEIRAPGRARAAYADAIAATEHLPAELPRARLETAYGRHLLDAGDRRGAVDLLRTAYERLERLGAAPFLARCAELLHAAGLHPTATGGALALTAQELAVARLVAEGRTNQEAGAALFVTSRTVAFHLSNIYAKLGVSSRRELAARLS
ncbi:MAG: AAA family ATPase [Pseudonocardia sp.]|nr:AAA family ATPase [Pseudonocardia sp.]